MIPLEIKEAFIRKVTDHKKRNVVPELRSVPLTHYDCKFRALPPQWPYKDERCDCYYWSGLTKPKCFDVRNDPSGYYRCTEGFQGGLE